MCKRLALVGAIIGLSATAAGAQEKLKIGVIATLSGPPAVLGQQLRNGFQLAVTNLGGKLGDGQQRCRGGVLPCGASCHDR